MATIAAELGRASHRFTASVTFRHSEKAFVTTEAIRTESVRQGMTSSGRTLLAYRKCRRAKLCRIASRLLGMRRWGGSSVCAPKWSRWLKMFGFVNTLHVGRSGLDHASGQSLHSFGVLERTWFGLKVVSSDDIRKIVLGEDSAQKLFDAIAVSNENARVRRIRHATAEARALARTLNLVIPPGSYVTLALRSRWRVHRPEAQRVIDALRREVGCIRPEFARLASWVDDPDSAAVAEREAAAAMAMRVHRTLLDSIERDPLTPTQRRAVVAGERRVAVNAGAGCGKTGTIIARAAYRVASEIRKPSQILALTFTRKAAAEMRQRFESADIRDVTALTYHSLARRIALQHLPGREILKLDKSEEAEAVRAVIDDLIHDASDARPAEFLVAHLYPSFVEPADGVRSDRSYIDYLKNFRLSALDGKAARSPLEVALLNTLLIAGVPFRHRPRDGAFRPTVVLDDGSKRAFDVRIVGCSGRDASFVPSSFQGAGGPEVSVLRCEVDQDGVDVRALRQALGLADRPTADDIARIPCLVGYDAALDQVTKLVLDFMRRFRASAKPIEELRALARSHRTRSFVALYEMFEMVAAAMLERARYVDFDGIIREATALLEAGRFRASWRDLILDEYQDVSEREIRFLEALAQAHDAEVFAVGDDWQAIYGFKGSAWDALQTFSSRFGGGDDVEVYEYPETHRSVDAIHEPAGRFVRRNPKQTQKRLSSTRPPALGPRIEIRGVSGQASNFPTQRLARDVLAELATSEVPPRDVLVLARAKKRLLEEEGTVGTGTYTSLTIHGAKGLGADVAIITDALASFPGRWLADPLLALVQRPEAFTNAEERRVFYVAMTRARDRVFILTDWNRRSSFLEEFRGDPNVLFVDEPPPGQPAEGALACPECRCGVATLSKFDNYVCTNWPFCDFIFPKCTCGDVIAVRRGTARCRGCSHVYWACWDCGRGVIERRPGRKKAWCTNYRFNDAGSCQAGKYVDRITEAESELLLVRSAW